MLGILILVVGIYILCALSVHLAYWFRKEKGQAGKHYVWVADGNEQQMEWYVRSMYSFSRRMGMDVKVTIVDHGLTEETRTIVDRLARRGKDLKLHAKEEASVSGKKNGKHPQTKGLDGTQLLWMLEAEGVVSRSDHAVLIDLQNPADLSKMPF